jgi:hypothetical protein
MAALLADDFVEFDSSGRVWAREAILEMVATETYSPPLVEFIGCRLLGPDVALLTYRTVPHEDRVATTLRSSIWTKESGAWKMCFHQGTRAS